MKKLTALLLLFPIAAMAQNPGRAAAVAGINWLGQIADIVGQLVTTHGGILLDDGRFLLAFVTFLGIIRIACNWQISMLGGGVTFAPIGHLVVFMFQALICSTMLQYYMAPFPGVGLSLHQLAPAVAHQLSNTFDTALIDQFLDQVNQIVFNLELPNFLNFMNVMLYFMILIMLGLMDLAVFLMNAFGYVALGVLTVLGPLFIPLFLTVHFNRWFWNWVDLMVVFSMYRATTAAFTFVFATLLNAFFTQSVHGDFSLGHFLALLPVMFMLSISFIWSMFRIPMFTSMIFGGAGAMGQAFNNAVMGTVTGLVNAAVAAGAAAGA